MLSDMLKGQENGHPCSYINKYFTTTVICLFEYSSMSGNISDDPSL